MIFSCNFDISSLPTNSRKILLSRQYNTVFFVLGEATIDALLEPNNSPFSPKTSILWHVSVHVHHVRSCHLLLLYIPLLLRCNNTYHKFLNPLEYPLIIMVFLNQYVEYVNMNIYATYSAYLARLLQNPAHTHKQRSVLLDLQLLNGHMIGRENCFVFVQQ